LGTPVYKHTVVFFSPIEVPEDMVTEQLEEYLTEALYDSRETFRAMAELEDNEEGEAGIAMGDFTVEEVGL
jgi:hypothetical protein